MENRLLKDPRFVVGMTLVALMILIAILAPLIAPYELSDGDFTSRLCPISADHWLGCDVNGQDVLTILIWGARVSLYVGSLTVLLSMTLGIGAGLVSGFFGGITDNIIMRIVDIFMAFPGILLAMALSAIMGPSINTVVFAIAATGWTSSARLVRGQVLSLADRDFVVASKGFGASKLRLMLIHILPHVWSPLIVHGTFSLSGVIIVEAGLSFLGLGAQGPIQTWGGLLSQATEIDLLESLNVSLAPGGAIFLLVVALNFIGDSLRDFFDPKKEKIR